MALLTTEKMSWEEVVNKTTNQIQALYPMLPEKRFRKWYEIKQYVGRPFDPNLIFQCFDAYTRAENNFDNFWAITGNEGIGKSTLARNLGYMINSDFKINNILFTLESYMEYLENMLSEGNTGGAIVIDEGGQLMFSRDAMSSTNKILVRTAMMQRKLRLTVLICIPNFFLLDSYPRNSRVNLLIHITKRGEYRGILKSGIEKLNVDALKYKNVGTIRLPTTQFWNGTFNKTIPQGFNEEEYEKKKDIYMKAYFQEARETRIGAGKAGYAIKLVDAAKEIGMKVSHLREWANKGKIKAFKIGFVWFIPRKDYESLLSSLKPKEISRVGDI